MLTKKANFIVTDKNVGFISTEMLAARYKTIQRWLTNKKVALHPDVQSELISEKELIQKTLSEKGAEELITEQLVFPGLEPPKKESYEKIVIDLLGKHFNQKYRVKQLSRQLVYGFELVFPSGTSNVYGNLSGISGGGSEFQSSSERAVIQLEDSIEAAQAEISQLLLEMKPMERAIDGLDELEKELVEKKFLTKPIPTDWEVIDSMHIAKTKFYEVKPTAIRKIAEALNIL
ncbi:hypothetical protein [Aneurinibacillus terranovensis]|uniref:hypothetical protein n=1 Tax=Aneurinibacillus terranovensis TaxID=278991 RepID=UPI00041FA74C|nr:hypothetical protein [Aneurinibacillus terranovensis]